MFCGVAAAMGCVENFRSVEASKRAIQPILKLSSYSM